MSRRPISVAAGIALAILAAAPPAPGQGVAYTGSLGYAGGDYIFAERTNSVLLFNGLSAAAGRFSASLSLPVIYQSTPWVSYASGVMIPSGGPESGEVGRMGDGRVGRRTTLEGIELADTATVGDFGLGDLSVLLGVEILRPAPTGPSLRLTASVKAPLADVDRGFGTGEWDYAAGLSVAQAFGRTLVFADAAWWILGDLPELELRDPLAYSLGVGRPLGERLGMLVSLAGYTTIIEGTDPPVQASLGLSYLLRANRSLLGSVALGLTDSSPDLSFSIGWRLGL